MAVVRDGTTEPWTPDEWQSIVWHARNVRTPSPHLVLGLTARGSAQRSAARLRELALQTEILVSLRGGLS